MLELVQVKRFLYGPQKGTYHQGKTEKPYTKNNKCMAKNLLVYEGITDTTLRPQLFRENSTTPFAVANNV